MFSGAREDAIWAGNGIRGTNIGRRQSAPIGVKPVRGNADLNPEANPWWWNPGRPGVRGCPDWFQRELDAFDSSGDLAITWNAYEERWYVWYRKPKLNVKHCSGWLMLFPVRYTGTNAYMPLDSRVFARLYASSAARWGNGLSYYNRIAYEQERDKELRAASHRDDSGWKARDFFAHTQPSVGYGPSNGSKFANNT